jgi:excisionase family DNA binding protein
MSKTIRLLTIHEAADLACCAPQTIRRAVRNGRLRAARAGSRGELRFLERWIDEWLIDQLMPQDHGIDVAINAGPRERDASHVWEVRHGHWI